jgi:hypothetical protein
VPHSGPDSLDGHRTVALCKSLEGKADPKVVQSRFAKVQKTWAELVVDYETLAPTNAILLHSKAALLDRI